MLQILKKAAFVCMCCVSCSFVSVDELTLEEKVGQLFMAHFTGKQANEDARILIQDVHVGSIIYYNWANGLTSFSQVLELSEGLQEIAKESRLSIPLLIAADQEGGVVTRLKEGFTQFPGNEAIGETGDPDFAEHCAYVMGQEMLAAGVNMNLAPVVDINNNPKNRVIGRRSFGDSPEKVAVFGERAVNGYQRAGVIACLKHFPGHGDVEVDSHFDLPIINKPLDVLVQCELFPFARLASKVDVMMTAHLLVPALDPEYCSTISERTLSYLRDSIGFQGVICSDSLTMKGVLKQCSDSVEEAAIAAFNAGCDILIFGGGQLIEGEARLEISVSDIQTIHANMVTAVKSGRITQQRLNESVQRILKLKEKSNLIPSQRQD